MKLLNVEQLWDGKYINMFRLSLLNKKNSPKDYYIISRRKKDNLVCITGNKDVCDGVIIIPFTNNGEVIILRQYRPAINDYLYELPSGMIDKGENIETAAKRELFEETGLKCLKYELVLKSSFSSVGISDEATAVTRMIVEGDITNKNTEDNEEIEVMKIKVSEAKDFVKGHNFSIKGALILSAIESYTF